MCKKTRFDLYTVVFKGSLLWNNLPNSYKDINTEFTFKRKDSNMEKYGKGENNDNEFLLILLYSWIV